MKIKVLSRNPDDYLRETKNDIHIEPRNYDPVLHPMEAPREFTRAVNAAKLQQVFAKPFTAALDGHRDVVNCMSKHPQKLSVIVSGAGDGEIKIWNLPTRKCIRSIAAHEGNVRGICFHPSGEYFFSCGDDQIIKQWRADIPEFADVDEPMDTILGKSLFQGIDHHWSENVFATCGTHLNIWNEGRAEPMRVYNDKRSVDSVMSVRFNPVETNLLGGTCQDRSIILYDMRASNEIRRVKLSMRSNMLAWNPMEAFNFTVANEDNNLYTYDMRKLSLPMNVHMDHVMAVLDVDYAPTGKEFVSGSYDKSIRIFNVRKGHSREIYHTERMQRVTGVKWSLDNNFILSASDEFNIRLWRADASKKLGVLRPREKVAFNYGQKLKEKYRHHPEVRRIIEHRHVPKPIYSVSKTLRVSKNAAARREANHRAHSKPGTVERIPERKKHVVKELE